MLCLFCCEFEGLCVGWSQTNDRSRLLKLLTQLMDGSKIIIFTETKRGADQLTRQLRMDGWPALAIHGDKSQSERDWVLNEFRDGKNPIMIATDVAARGLGILLGVLASLFPFPSHFVVLYRHFFASPAGSLTSLSCTHKRSIAKMAFFFLEEKQVFYYIQKYIAKAIVLVWLAGK